MRPGMLTWLVSLYFLIAAASSPRDQQQFRDQQQPDENLPEIKAVSTVLRQEPTCDELRAMWRFSKRQSRAAENSNEIPTYRDPFSYNVWDEQATLRSVGGPRLRRPLVYGRLVHGVPGPRFLETTPERVRAFEEVARLFGTSVARSKAHGRRRPTSTRQVGGHGSSQNLPQTGSFQHLKELIQTERARELHEQKMLEENAVRDRYRNMMLPDQSSSTGLIPYGQREQDDYYNAGGGRGRGQGDGVVFPDVLAPSNYEPPPPPSGYYRTANYMPRPYPEPMNVADQSMLSSEIGEYENRSARSAGMSYHAPLLGNEVALYKPQSSPPEEKHHQIPISSQTKPRPHARNKQILKVLTEYKRYIRQLLFKFFFVIAKTSTPPTPTDFLAFLVQKLPFTSGKSDNFKGGYDMKALPKLKIKMDDTLSNTDDLDNVANIVPKKGDFNVKDLENEHSIFTGFLPSDYYTQVKTRGLGVDTNSKYIPLAEEYEKYLTQVLSLIGNELIFGKNTKYESKRSPFFGKAHKTQGAGINLLESVRNVFLGKGKVCKVLSAVRDTPQHQINKRNIPNEGGKSHIKFNGWTYWIGGENPNEKDHYKNKFKDMRVAKEKESANGNPFQSSVSVGSKEQMNSAYTENRE